MPLSMAPRRLTTPAPGKAKSTTLPAPWAPKAADILDEGRSFRHKSGPPGYKLLISRTPVWSLGLRGESNMPKMKSNRAASKRFKVSGSGRVRRSKCGAQHNMIGKSRTRRRRLRNQDMVDKAMEGRVKLLLPYG